MHQLSRILIFMLACLLVFRLQASAQDTLTVMQYNLTNYGNPQTGCTAANNGLALKDGYLATIFGYIQPDILGVNEMYRSDATADRITGVLNARGYATFARPRIINLTTSSLVNSLYYRTDKLVLKSHQGVNSSVRTIDHFRLYYKSADLATNPDTAFINILICHLKAGNTASDASDRNLMAQAVVNYLRNNNARGNWMIMGDFNVYNSNEAAFTALTTNNTYGPVKFADPLNALGSWSANSSFARYHTQSTNSSSNGCFSGGGMDDRFDIFLANQYLLRDSGGVSIIPNSYQVVGNNGGVYNRSINVSGNTAAPSNILDALAGNSDHAPIRLKLRVNRPKITTSLPGALLNGLSAYYRSDIASVVINSKEGSTSELSFELFNNAGQSMHAGQTSIVDGQSLISTKNLSRGVYYLKLSTHNQVKTTKIVIW